MLDKLKKIFSSSTSSQELPWSVDIHSHLIPNIDDGAKTMAESIMLIKKMKELGFSKLITTPHIMSHRYTNTTGSILKGLSRVQSELEKQNIDIVLEASAEYYLDEHLLKLIHDRDILTFGKNYLLFEMSYNNRPMQLEAVIFEMKVSGYQPVLAHPERYFFMHKNFDEYKKLKDLDVLFQVNLNSLGGYYSKEVQKVAHKLLEKGLIDFIGSDIHKLNHFEHFSKNASPTLLKKLLHKNSIMNSQLF